MNHLGYSLGANLMVKVEITQPVFEAQVPFEKTCQQSRPGTCADRGSEETNTLGGILVNQVHRTYRLWLFSWVGLIDASFVYPGHVYVTCFEAFHCPVEYSVPYHKHFSLLDSPPGFGPPLRQHRVLVQAWILLFRWLASP